MIPTAVAMTMAAMAAVPTQYPAPNAGSRSLIDDLQICRAITADDARVACYDRAADALLQARQRKDIVVMDRAEVQTAKRSLFGFSLPSIRLFGDDDGRDDKGAGGDGALKQLVGTLQSSSPLPGGLMRFALDGGGTWETTEQVMASLRRGDSVTIKAGALGSYIATAPGRRSVRVRRIR